MNDKPSVMKTVIIEDEKAAVRNLTSLLNEVKPEAEIIAILDSINSTIEWFGIHPMPELVFMDIHLADGSAFEIFDHISITCPIIFTTAYDEYAMEAIKNNGLDYLMKPIDAGELRAAIGKLRFNRYAQQSAVVSPLHDVLNDTRQYRERFLITKGDELCMLCADDICYINMPVSYTHLRAHET